MSTIQDLLFKAGLDSSNFNTGIDGMISKLGKMAMAGLTIGAVVGLLKNIGEEAIKDETATYGLASAVKGLKGATEDNFIALNNWAEKTSEMTGEHLPEMKNQLQELVRLTGSTTLAEKSYMVALDMSRSGLMDMDSAVKIVSKAVNGHTAALARYGIQMDKNATSQEVLNTLTKKFGGGEDSYLKTTAGQIQVAQNNFNLLENELGQVFLPVLGEAARAIAYFFTQFTTQGRVVEEMQKHMALLSMEIKNSTDAMNLAVAKGDTQAAFQLYNRIKGLKMDLDNVKGQLDKSGGAFGNTVDLKQIYKNAKAGPGDTGDTGGGGGKVDDMQKSADEMSAAFDKQRDEQIKDEQNFNEIIAALEKQRNEANLDSTMGTLSKIRELHAGHSKVLFEITKGAGIAEIGISTAQAIMKTLAEGGMFAIPESIAIGAVGAQQMAAAASATFNPGGAANGIFDFRAPGNTEHLVTTIGTGESILSAPQTQALKQGIGGGGSEYHVHIHTDNLTDAGQITKTQILPEIKKFIIQDRGGQVSMADGSPNW
jgi:hypothetical protein